MVTVVITLLHNALLAASEAAVYVASSSSSSSSDDWRIVALALFLAGPITYYAIYRYYRNPGARFKYEEDTEATCANMALRDAFLESKRGTRDSELSGANSDKLFGLDK